MTFTDRLNQFQWHDVSEQIYSKTSADVEHALNKRNRNLNDFMAFLSPAASEFLEPMALESKRLTEQRFGKTIQLYAPMYLSNKCTNICTYCGFSVTNNIKRLTLDDEMILKEVAVIKSHGFDHILLVTGEAVKEVDVDYFENAIRLIRPHFSSISLEVQPLDQNDYERLIRAGLDTVLVYQETYRQETYRNYHPKGKKSHFGYRLETPERLGNSGIRKMGIGALIGLEDWRVDSFMVGLHLEYLKRQFWKSKYSISFPRLRPAAGEFQANVHLTDKELVQLLFAYRLFDPDVELSLSTREPVNLRDNLVGLGVTTMSAGSKTDPGGYSTEEHAEEQFHISDERSPELVATMIRNKGFEVVWKDWDNQF